MKKLLIVLAFAGVSFSGMAQDTEATQKYSVATNSFWSNWFIQVGADWNAYYTGEEHGANLHIQPWKRFRANPGASFAIGKWFTPGLGLRTKVQGIWGKQVYGNENDYLKGNKYWVANEQVLFNVSNMLCGYNPTRTWNFIPFAGAGVARSMTYNRYATGLSAGILNTFRVSRHVAINLEFGWNRYEGDFDGINVGENNNRGWDSHDNNLYGEVGLTFNLGKSTWSKTPDVDAIKAAYQSQIDALNSQLADAAAENARLKNLLANQKPAQTVTKYASAPVSVFFDLNKIKIASDRDLIAVKDFADFAKENNASVLVKGYADSATGTPAYNQRISEHRANVLADKLVEYGVNRDNITVEAKGGVDTLSPVSYNRRATAEVK